MNERIPDYSEKMKAHPEEYGFTREELSALTREELMRGVTKEYITLFGEWLLARSNRRVRKGHSVPVARSAI